MTTGLVLLLALALLDFLVPRGSWYADHPMSSAALSTLVGFLAAGHDLDRVLLTDDLVHCDNVFFAATGITDGELLDGVQYYGDGARTHSLVMRSKSGTVREVIARHRWDKLMQFSQVKYD